MTLQRLHHLGVELTDVAEALQRGSLEQQQAGAGHAAAFFVLFLGLQLLFHHLFGDFLSDDLFGVGVEQAVHDLIDAHLVAHDALRQLQNLGDGGRTGGDGLDHVAQAVLDALGDLDFALARE